jgi:hypothetical protein
MEKHHFATREDLFKVKEELLKEIITVKFDLLKWIFAFWIANAAMIIGLYFR